MSGFGQAKVAYRVDLRKPDQHRAEIELELVCESLPDTIDLQMAAWCPGSYLVRDYARQLSDMTVSGDGERTVEKVDKHTFRVSCRGGKKLVVRYQIYGYELSVRTNHIDGSHAFLHGPATFLYCPELRDSPCTVTVEAPFSWKVHCALERTGPALLARHIDELFDSPIHLSADEPTSFVVADRRIDLVVWGEPDRGRFTRADLQRDLEKIVAAHCARLEDAPPYARYLFLLMLCPGKYGGLEHRSSSANLSTPFAFVDKQGYGDMLELLSHEYFHLWNGKRIYPKVFERFDYTQENYTRALWVIEGMTSYYDRLTLVQSGTMGVARFFEKLAEEIATLHATPGARRHSLEAASFDAWIKFYKPDEDTVNSTVSYYLKGGLVHATLDLEIRRQTGGERSLDHVLRMLWQRFGKVDRGYPEELLPLFEEASGARLGEFFDRYVRGTENPDLAPYLTDMGLVLKSQSSEEEPAEGEAEPVWIGVELQGRRVMTVFEGGPGHGVGLAPFDEIIAVDGYRIEHDGDVRKRLPGRKPGDALEVSVFRRERLMTVSVPLAACPPRRFQVLAHPEATPEQKARFTAWIGQTFPKAGSVGSKTFNRWL